MYALLYMDMFKVSQALNQDGRNNRKLKGAEGNSVDCMPGNEFRYLYRRSGTRSNGRACLIIASTLTTAALQTNIGVRPSSTLNGKCDVYKKNALSIRFKGIARQSAVILSP